MAPSFWFGFYRKSIKPDLGSRFNFQLSLGHFHEIPYALYVLDFHDKDNLKVPMIRISKSSLNSVLLQYLINHLMHIAINKKKSKITVNDYIVSDDIRDLLLINGYIDEKQCYSRYLYNGILSTNEFLDRLKANENIVSHFKLESVSKDLSKNNIYNLEQQFYPIKIYDLEIPSYIIPIYPYWAEQLFEEDIGEYSLIGSDPLLILRNHNIYYRSSKMNIKYPARILWYICKSKDKMPKIQCISGCSYLDEVYVDKPVQLFKRFKKFGIYKWGDIAKTVKGDLNKSLMAMLFSKYEKFKTPISLKELENIWKKYKNSNYNPQGAKLIPNEMFFEMYSIGMK